MPLSLGFGEWGCPYHCNTGTKCSFSLRGGPKKRREWGEEEEEQRPFPYPFRHLLRSLVFTCSGNSIWRGLSDWQNLSAVTRFLFIEVLFRTFLYYYWGKENCSWYRGLGYIEVRCSIEVPLYGGVWQRPTVGVRFIDVSVRELIIS